MRCKMRILPLLLVITPLPALILACGSGDDMASVTQNSPQVKVVRMLGDKSFDPKNLTIEYGDRVVWINMVNDQHTTTDGAPCIPTGLWSSGILDKDGSFSVVFDSTGLDTTGTLFYHCETHCDRGMTGTITVQP